MADHLLLAAVAAGDVDEAARLLDEDNADVNAPNGCGSSALHLAAAAGSARMAEMLLSRGADCRARESTALAVGGSTPLMLAVRRGALDVVEMLIAEGGARVNDATTSGPAGMTPLHDACAAGDADLVKLLLAAGADGGARDADGRNPAYHAHLSGHAAALAAGVRLGLPAASCLTAEERVAWGALVKHGGPPPPPRITEKKKKGAGAAKKK